MPSSGRADCFREVLNILPDSKALLIFHFNFRLLSAFIPWLTERARLTSDCSIRNLRHRGTSKHRVNANESCPYALAGSRWIRVYIICGVDRERAEFFGNKQFHSLENTQTLNFLYWYRSTNASAQAPLSVCNLPNCQPKRNIPVL